MIARETMEILELVEHNFQGRMIQRLQLLSRSVDFWWCELLRDGSCRFQLSVYPSFQWISAEGRYFRHRRSTTVGSPAFRSGLIDKYCRIILKYLKKLWSFGKATWFLCLESAGHSGLVQRLMSRFFFELLTHHTRKVQWRRQDFSLGA